MTLTENNIATTTLQLIRKRMADNIFKANPLAAWMLMRGRVRVENGGKRIDEPLMYATNSTVQAYKGYDRLNVFPTEELTNAQFAWRQAAASISLSGLEDLQNAGESAVFNLLKTKIKIAEMSLKQWLAEKLLANTSTKDTARDFLGLDELVEDLAGASQGIVGGIDRSVETWWQNHYQDFTTNLGSSTTALNKNLGETYYNVTKGLSQPDLILTDQHMFQRYEDDNRSLLRLTDTSLVDIGFNNLKFKGATMMWDENIQSGTNITGGAGTPGSSGANVEHLFYFLNSEYLSLALHTRRNFVMTPFVTPYDQDAQIAQILLAGNMTVNNSRFQGVIKVAE
tara:strand:- start:6303 stop:7322 length:1020 start_codon:yes stop_codon:yes gene_type:complete